MQTPDRNSINPYQRISSAMHGLSNGVSCLNASIELANQRLQDISPMIATMSKSCSTLSEELEILEGGSQSVPNYRRRVNSMRTSLSQTQQCLEYYLQLERDLKQYVQGATSYQLNPACSPQLRPGNPHLEFRRLTDEQD